MKKTKESEAPEERTDLAIFKVLFESNEPNVIGWQKDEMNALAFDAETAIDKVKTEVTKKRGERFKLLGVIELARASL